MGDSDRAGRVTRKPAVPDEGADKQLQSQQRRSRRRQEDEREEETAESRRCPAAGGAGLRLAKPAGRVTRIGWAGRVTRIGPHLLDEELHVGDAVEACEGGAAGREFAFQASRR